VKHASVQATRLQIDAIQDGVVRSSEGDYHAILEVNGTTSPFEHDAQQEAVLAGFATFLNALNYPIQILVRASPVDLSLYVTRLEERGRTVLHGELADLAHDQAAFVQALARRRTLLERRFYLAVAAESTVRHGWRRPWFQSRRGSDDAPARDAARRQLTFRCDDISRQLARCGLGTRRLADVELAELYLACWSPERCRGQRFRQQLDDYMSLAVRRGTAAPSRARE
jgi:hypothetical protein